MVGKPNVSEKTSFGSEPPAFGMMVGALPPVFSIEEATKRTQG